MNATRDHRKYVPRLVVALVAAAMLSGCGKSVPAEANAALHGALDKLASGDVAGFIEAVLPAQREQALKREEMGFFRRVKSHRIDNEFDLDVTDTSAAIMTVLYFDDEQKAFSNVFMVMKQVDGAWYIDLDETIKKERAANGVEAFEVWQFSE